MTQYKIQVGSWTKLPNGKVQMDTRDIMRMMADKISGVVERWYTPEQDDECDNIGVNDDFTIKVYNGVGYEAQGLKNEPALFIPYAELQKMLNALNVQDIPRVSSLLNTKLDCRKPDGTVDEELSRAFQEAVTGGSHSKYGGWSMSSYKQSIEIFTASPFLFVSENGMLSLGTHEEEDHFNRNSKTQINFKYSRKLTWEATEVPTKIEPDVVEEDKMVDICGVLYSAKELSEALALINSSRK